MTTGHKHRTVRIQTFNVWWVRLLRWQFYRTTNLAWVEESRLVFGLVDEPKSCNRAGQVRGCKRCEQEQWGLSLLGVLHSLFGVVLQTPPPPAVKRTPTRYKP